MRYQIQYRNRYGEWYSMMDDLYTTRRGTRKRLNHPMFKHLRARVLDKRTGKYYYHW